MFQQRENSKPWGALPVLLRQRVVGARESKLACRRADIRQIVEIFGFDISDREIAEAARCTIETVRKWRPGAEAFLRANGRREIAEIAADVGLKEHHLNPLRAQPKAEKIADLGITPHAHACGADTDEARLTAHEAEMQGITHNSTSMIAEAISLHEQLVDEDAALDAYADEADKGNGTSDLYLVFLRSLLVKGQS